MREQPSRISVIGSGAWGLAIAELLARNGHLVEVFSRSPDKAKTLNQKYLKLNLSITVTTSLPVTDFIFVAVPSDIFLSVLKSLTKEKISLKSKIILCCKGIDGKNLELFSSSIEKTFPKNNYAILSGPNFASEVSDSLPTTTTIASKNKSSTKQIASLLKNDNFLPIISNDVISTQIFGAIKNILAIGCGIIDGLNLGENAKAALVLKGIAEANNLIKKLGGDAQKSFISPCGLGDVFLTCSSKKSRNNSLGYTVGKGEKIGNSLDNKTFEGFTASKSIIKFAKKHKTTLPLCEAINKILNNGFSAKEMKLILSQAILKE
ncbi:MAG: hypothetical protein K0R25_246 [Rickettsiaceae bacterium]|jgi:glycerol-3-phosphate dehydrogenase (NAD(P)+)|nr:hypothetical protein [Rickettsiaceae bacterium]